jgi:primosomal protein N' (replication factor Y)
MRERVLRCHYCDYRVPAPGHCPECQGVNLHLQGWGTERLEEEVSSLFQGAHIARMDRDTTGRKRAHEKILKRLASGKIDILIGTQMIAKGHDVPRVTLVGVILADLSLNFPDFRSGERTFQILTQVAGRAGRGDLPGKVVIQTFDPGNYTIRAAGRHDFSRYYEREIEIRRELGYPPFSRLINFRLEGTSRERTEGAAKRFGEACQGLLKERFSAEVTGLGPAPAPWEKMRGRYRWQFLVKGRKTPALRRFASLVLNHIAPRFMGSGVRVVVDVDPLFLM